MDATEHDVSIPALFGKAEVASVQVSPLGKWLGWLARNDGVLNLWIAPMPLQEKSGDSKNCIIGARQLTAVSDGRDVAFCWRFTSDDKRIVYIRESRHGSEFYHLYTVDLALFNEESCVPVAEGHDLFANHPELTCAVGFVGGLQLWLPKNAPDTAVLATGRGSLLWDLSTVNLATGALTTVHRNPCATTWGCVVLVVRLVLHLFAEGLAFLLKLATAGFVVNLPVTFPPPSAPLQYFVDSSTGTLVGAAECAISLDGLSLQFSQRRRGGRGWSRVGPAIPLGDLNMQLVGSGAATGTLRFDVTTQSGESESEGGDACCSRVAVHTCTTHDTTAYVEYPTNGTVGTVGKVLAHSPKADISDFICHPATGEVEAVVVTAARSEIIPVTASGWRVKAALARAAVSLNRAGEDDSVVLVSRSEADDVWVVRGSSDKEAATYFLVCDPYQRGGGGGGDDEDGKHPSATTERLPQGTPLPTGTQLPPPLPPPPPRPWLLLSSRPGLSSGPCQRLLARSNAVQVPTRDGETLLCYLTLPLDANRAAESGTATTRAVLFPLALVLHGGPSARDYPGFDPLTQLLATRGIAVLSVNYRGSTGFGMRFLRLGNGGLQGMHNDVEDARRWATGPTSGLAVDPKRVAIVGGSWGGYLALGGATGLGKTRWARRRRRERKGSAYAAVVAVVPLVCVGAANDSKAFRGDPLVARYWKMVHGPSVARSKEAAERLSPVCHLPKLKGCKLFLAHGESDPRVPREHGDKVAAAAQALGVEGVHVTYASEGHSIRREPNVLHLWAHVEHFLCRSLGLPPTPHLLPGSTSGHTATVHWTSPSLLNLNLN